MYGFWAFPHIMLAPFVGLAGMISYIILSCYAVTLEPIIHTISRFKTHKEYHAIIEKNHDERSKLLAELIDLNAQLVMYKDLRDLGIVREENTIIGRIFYKQLHQVDSFFIVDKGSRDGVTSDMVAKLNNILLGRVVAVYPAYCKVMPVTDAQCYVPIVCATSRAHGVFHGNQLDFVSHLEPLVVDELVLTSGDGLIYPAGLALGSIKKFELNDLGFLYRVEVDPLYDLEHITYCSLVSKNATLE